MFTRIICVAMLVLGASAPAAHAQGECWRYAEAVAQEELIPIGLTANAGWVLGTVERAEGRPLSGPGSMPVTDVVVSVERGYEYVDELRTDHAPAEIDILMQGGAILPEDFDGTITREVERNTRFATHDETYPLFVGERVWIAYRILEDGTRQMFHKVTAPDERDYDPLCYAIGSNEWLYHARDAERSEADLIYITPDGQKHYGMRAWLLAETAAKPELQVGTVSELVDSFEVVRQLTIDAADAGERIPGRM